MVPVVDAGVALASQKRLAAAVAPKLSTFAAAPGPETPPRPMDILELCRNPVLLANPDLLARLVATALANVPPPAPAAAPAGAPSAVVVHRKSPGGSRTAASVRYFLAGTLACVSCLQALPTQLFLREIRRLVMGGGAFVFRGNYLDRMDMVGIKWQAVRAYLEDKFPGMEDKIGASA
jgi:hypothetical protein